MSTRLVPVFNYLDQCEGKRRYKRRRDAVKAKRQVETAYRGRKLIAYPCPHCQTWHLGNMREVEEPKRGFKARW